ncbi:MAG: flagellar biosynthesis anti-sigma factor FlgM [Pseudomonadota bacterium]|nr:flagellar biosynthesis anti-sigma factor FlgM [Pseudomonadota bacterium]
MVDPIASRLTQASDLTVAAVSRAKPAPAPTPVARETDQAPVQVSNIAGELAASPPVDLERVARIKKAIANGTFPIYPATIADRLIALKYDWKPHDQA